MYNKFRIEFLTKLYSYGMTSEEINKIANCLDHTSQNYNITNKCTDISIYDNNEMYKELKEFLVSRKIEGYSSLTLKNDRIILSNMTSSINKHVSDITTNDIRIYLYEYKKLRQCSDRSLDKVRQKLSSYFNWLTLEKYIDSNPMKSIKPIKYDKTQRKHLEQIELEYMRKSCINERERAFLEFFYSTGCRVSEAANAQISNVNWDNNTIVVMGKGKKERTVYLNAKAQIALKLYLNSRNDDCPNLFVSHRGSHPINSQSIEREIKAIGERSGLNFVTPHILRHTTATQAIKSGMPVQDIQKILGHSQINTTMIYAQVDDNHIKSEHLRCIV